jgi:hypothetical protein
VIINAHKILFWKLSLKRRPLEWRSGRPSNKGIWPPETGASTSTARQGLHVPWRYFCSVALLPATVSNGTIDSKWPAGMYVYRNVAFSLEVEVEREFLLECVRCYEGLTYGYNQNRFVTWDGGAL